MGPSRYGLKREQIFDELMTAMNSSDPLESALSRVTKLIDGGGLVVNDLGEIVRSVGSAPNKLIARWVHEEAAVAVQSSQATAMKSGMIGRWHVFAQTVRLRSREHVIVVAVPADGAEAEQSVATAEVILDVASKLLRAFEGFETFSISNRREESSRVLRDLEAGVSPGREPAIWRILESFGFTSYEPIRALRIRLDGTDAVPIRQAPSPGGGLVIKESGNGSSVIEQTAICTADFDVEGGFDAAGLVGVGVSGLFTGLSQVPEMLQTADVALASVREAKFAFVDRMRPVEWAAARMNSRFDRRLVEVFLAPIMNGPEAQKTLRTYVECGGSIAGVAARLQVHENTVRYRIGQVEKMLGSRLTDPRTAAEIVLALQCLNTAKQG